MGVIEGRQTAAYDQDVVVFLIGMRVNKLRAWRRELLGEERGRVEGGRHRR